MSKIDIIELATRTHEMMGSLSFFEGNKDIPFTIKRIYYIYNVPQHGRRGAHAHKNLQQILFCPYGSVEIILDDGDQKTHVLLNNPSKGLVIGSGIWRDMVWQHTGSVLCVAASAYYDEKDYIREYDQFIIMKKGGYWDEH